MDDNKIALYIMLGACAIIVASLGYDVIDAIGPGLVLVIVVIAGLVALGGWITLAVAGLIYGPPALLYWLGVWVARLFAKKGAD